MDSSLSPTSERDGHGYCWIEVDPFPFLLHQSG